MFTTIVDAESQSDKLGKNGQKFGEYSPTRTYYGHGADKKAKRK